MGQVAPEIERERVCLYVCGSEGWLKDRVSGNSVDSLSTLGADRPETLSPQQGSGQSHKWPKMTKYTVITVKHQMISFYGA